MGQSQINAIIRVAVAPGSVTSALEPLRMARKLDPYRETSRIALEPWLVEAALARVGRTLSPADQRLVIEATRTPHKVRWPEWWSEYP
jgi:D-alanyl-D-alanine dipeptidase